MVSLGKQACANIGSIITEGYYSGTDHVVLFVNKRGTRESSGGSCQKPVRMNSAIRMRKHPTRVIVSRVGAHNRTYSRLSGCAVGFLKKNKMAHLI